MKKKLVWGFLGAVLFAAAAILLTAPEDKKSGTSKPFHNNLPLYFVENRGQAGPADIKYHAQTKTADIYFGKDRSVISIKGPGNREKSVLRLEYLGAGSGTKISGRDRTKAVFNYLTGNKKEGHKTNVPSYFGIILKNLYNGIDLEYGSKNGSVKSEFVIGRKGKAADIRLRYAGADFLSINKSGDLIVKAGAVKLVESKPYAYQIIGGKIATVEAHYVLLAHDTYGFKTGNYNKLHPLIIDPTLVFSGYIGGTGNDEGEEIFVDSSGYIYIGCETYSDNFPSTPGAYQTTRAGTQNLVISKLSPDASGLEFSTYFGGNGQDFVNALKCDDSGNIYVGGYTNSSNLPATPGCYDNTRSGALDCFVLKLNSTGSAVLYCSYFGGSDNDVAYASCVDDSYNIYLSGYCSSDMPTTPNAYKTVFPGGTSNFAAKLSPSGLGANDLIYSTFIGSGTTRQMQVDSSGNVCLVGDTTSSEYPVTSGCFQPTFGGGDRDAFVTKLNSDGSDLVFSTFLGGSDTDRGWQANVDASSNVYASCTTLSTDFPVSGGAFQTSRPSALLNGSLSKFSPEGALLYSTYVGGSGVDNSLKMAAARSGDIFLAGYTTSADFPVTDDAYQKELKGGYDGLLIRLSPSGNGSSDLVYSTFFGGSSDDTLKDLFLTQSNTLYIFGYSASNDMPVTAGVYSAVNSGGTDAVYVRFELGPPAPSSFLSAAASTTSLSHSWAVNSTNESGFYIVDGSGAIRLRVPAAASTTVEAALLPNTLYTSRCTAYNGDGAFTSEASSKYTWIEAPSGLGSINTSSTSITVKAEGTFSNLSLGSSGILIENLTDGTNSGWIKADSWTFSDLLPGTEYSFRVRSRNGDAIENPVPFSKTLATAAKTPISVYSAGVQLRDGDTVSSRLAFSGIASTTEALDASSVRIYLDGSLVSDGTYSYYDSFEQAPDRATISYSVRTPLAAGTHTLSITAGGSGGSLFEASLVDLRVASETGSQGIIGAVLAHPNPYDPSSGNARITYNLEKDSAIALYIFGINGRLVLKKEFLSGSNGGKAGFNDVAWDGKDDFGNELGNGVYAVRIVDKAGMKVIGKSKVAIICGSASKTGAPLWPLAAVITAVLGLTASGGAHRFYRALKRKK
ncbi:MAG: SBBP repeat-containing protein [Candidatus Margulisiibacteriota bacterium]